MLLALNSGENDRMSIGSLTANHIPAYNDGLVCANRQHSAVLGYSIAMLGENGAWIEASIPPLPICGATARSTRSRRNTSTTRVLPILSLSRCPGSKAQ